MTLDRTLNKLVATGNAQLKAPDGQIIRADQLEATEAFRRAFEDLLKLSEPDGSHRTGPRMEIDPPRK